MREARRHIAGQSVDGRLLASVIEAPRLLEEMEQMPLLLTYLLALWCLQGKKSKLFADPIEASTPSGEVTIYLQLTK